MIDAFLHVVAKDAAGIAQDLIDLDFLKPGADEERHQRSRHKNVRAASRFEIKRREI